VIEAAIDAKKKPVEKWLASKGAVPPEVPPTIGDVSKAWNANEYDKVLSLVRKLQYTDEDTLGLEGIAHEFLGRSARAISALQKSVKQEPTNAMWRNCLAWSLAAAGRTREATTHYRKALAQVELDLADEPDEASLWSRKAYALNGLGRFDEALAAAKEAIGIEADHTLALVNAGRAHLAAKQHEEARDMLERAVKSDPVLAEPKLWLAIARARCADAKGAKAMLAKIAVSPHLVALAKKEPSLAPLMKNRK
jgi:tetratricopeptide (TPR) repeat protein